MSYDRGRLAGVWEDSGPLVRMRLSLSRTLWRIGPAWSVLAGALVFGWAPTSAAAFLQLAAAVVLGDLAWGSLRQIVPLGSTGLGSPGASPLILPYARPEASLARVLNRLASNSELSAASAWQPLVASLVLVAALSLLLGPAALALSSGVVLLVALAWLLVANRRRYPALCLAMLDVTAPWLLGMSWAGLGGLASRTAPGPFMLMAGFTLLQWGVYRARQSDEASRIGLWAGQAAVLVALIATRQAAACAIVAVLFVPPSWWLLRRDCSGLPRALPWWWAAFEVAALAQTIHAL